MHLLFHYAVSRLTILHDAEQAFKNNKKNGLRCNENKNPVFLTKKPAMKGCRVETFGSILRGYPEM